MRIQCTVVCLSVWIAASAAFGEPTWSAIGPTSLNVAPGEEFTISLAIDNPGGTSVVGVNGQLTGLLSAEATVVSGQSALFHFVQFCSSPTACFGGIDSANNPFYNPNDLASNGAFVQGVNDNLQIINAIAINGTTADGSLDPGLDGTALDVSVTLSLPNVGIHVLTIGGEWGEEGALIADPLNTIPITVTVPEPSEAFASMASLATVASIMAVRRRR